MKKRFNWWPKISIVVLILCCLMIIPMVGCTTKKATTTGTTQTPLQVLTGRVNASDSINSRQDQNITDLSNRITGVEGRPQVDISPLTARVLILEGLNLSNYNASLAFFGVRLSSLESYNISARLLALETGSANISARLRAIEVLLNISTNVSPTPTPIGGNHAPIVYDIAYDNFSEAIYYAILNCNASDQDGDSLTYTWFTNTSFINNGHSKVYWIPPYVGWNGTTEYISVIVTDGRGGNFSFSRPISH